ncbi:MAG: hypothetical protein M3R07_00775 [Gemmatimonadota bacterium]|nr:hypothetical protein [Gemmatimonadota bacterium]
MVLSEALGAAEFESRVKIYATDIDDGALLAARRGYFPANQVASVPGHLLQKYFVKVEGWCRFREEFRRNVFFGRHDLLQDAPIPRVDILVCRNTLMYFNAPAQSVVLARFHYALTEGGYRFLGRAETLLAHRATFRPVDLRRRVFAKLPSANLNTQLHLAVESPVIDR